MEDLSSQAAPGAANSTQTPARETRAAVNSSGDASVMSTHYQDPTTF